MEAGLGQLVEAVQLSCERLARAASASSQRRRRALARRRAAPPSPRPARSGRHAAEPRRGELAHSSRSGGRRRSGRRRSRPARCATACSSASRRSAGRGPARRDSRKLSSRSSGRSGDHVRAVVGAAAKLRRRLGEDREAGGLGQGGERLAQLGSSWRPATITPERALGMWPAISSSRNAEGSMSIGVTAVSGRTSRPSRASGSVAVTALSAGSGASGSRQGMLRWTGPGAARRALPRGHGRRSSGSAAGPRRRRRGSRLRRTSAPRSRRASAGRSSARRRSRAARGAVGGQRDQRQRRLVGLADRRVDSSPPPCPRCRASPRAHRWPVRRRARRRRQSARRGSRSPRSPAGARAPRASGVEREPGETTAWRTPPRASSSTKAEARAVLALVGSIVGRLLATYPSI